MKLPALAVLLAVAAGCSSATAPPQEQPPAAYLDRMLWTMRPDGTDKQRLTAP
jgi:hypothetical protein